MLKSWSKMLKWAVSVMLLVAVLLVVSVLHHEITLETAQRNFLALLEEKEGFYHQNRIVLSATNWQEAEQLAEQVGGTLRITKNGVFAVITLPDGMTVAEFAEEDENREYLSRMSLDYNNFSITTESEDTADGVRTGFQVVDEMYPQQNYLDYINIGNTWNISRGETSDGEKVTIAIIDSGIDTDHPEFTDAEGNSIINIHSYDASNDKTVNQYGIDVIEDINGHGTAVAGVIAAQMNEEGIAGIAPDVELLVIKCDVNEAGEFTSSSDIVFAIYYAIEMDADVINMSLGGDGGNDMEAAIQLAVDSDIICVAAAGNDTTEAPHYPAAYDTVIGVGALAENSWTIADYSNYGVNSDIMAPGTALTTAIGGGYTYENGTSMAAPIVSASVALYLSQNKYTAYDIVKAELLAAGKDLGDLGEDDTYGFGALDLNAFVCEEKGTITYDYCTADIKNTTQVFVRQHTIQTVPEPERDNIILDDWYYDKAYTRVFDYDAWYSTEFVEDVTLYAKWVNEDDEGASVYNYQTLSDGTIEIVSYKGKRRYLTIPNEIDGKVVSSIGKNAFAGNTRLREVTFPEGLVYIKEGAFSNVSKMREITFTGTRLIAIKIKAFYGCSALKTLNLPESVQTIGEAAFESCSAMTAVNIPTTSSLESMGSFAFSGTKITSFYLPANVGSDGFDGSVLADCSNMRGVSVHSGNSQFIVSDNTLYGADKTQIVYYPAALTGSYAVADGVTTIGDYAFTGSALSSIDLNQTVSIGERAFANTKNVSSIVLPDTVTSLGASAFASSSISQVTISENLTEISEGAFSGSKLKSVHIPNKVQTIADKAFSSCIYLKELTFGEDSELLEINDDAFGSCRLLDSFLLPDTLQTIGNKAFYQCASIVELTIPENVTTIGEGAFQYCTKLQVVTFTDGCALKTVPKYCFANCTMLQSAAFSDGITMLDNYAFSNDRLLQQLNFSSNSSLRTVGDYSFYSCSLLQTMQLPESVTAIGQFAYAFSGLKQVDISAKVSSIGNAAFGACYTLTKFNVEEANAVYTAVDNVLFDKSVTTVYCVPASRTGSYTLPETVEVTAPYSFYHDIFLTAVVLPEGLTDIQQNSFYNCIILAGIDIPANVTNIGRQAFENCYNLTAVSIGENSKLLRLGIYTFVNCGMTEITIPASVEEIAQYAFYNCDELKKITFEESSALTYISAYLLKGTKVENVVFEEGSALTSLQAHAFDGASYLESVDFGNAAVTNVDNYAFYNCTNLETISIPDSVTYIGRYAFYNCTKLSRMDLPGGMDYIGESAFYGTTNMKVYFAADTLPAYAQVGWDKGIAGYFLGAVDYIVANEWEYAVSANGTITLAAYKGDATELTVDTVDGYTVTKIGARCFAENDALTSVILSSNITEIGNYAFYDCDGLTSITVPASVTRIGKYAFAESVAVVTLAEGSALVTIDDYAFAGNVTTSITLPNSVTEIGEGVFQNSKLTTLSIDTNSALKSIGRQAFVGSSITSICLPAALENVGAEVFQNVTSLTSVTIAEGETALKLSNSAFEGSGIAEITLPARVYYIGEYAFGSCPNLQNIYVDSASESYTALDGVLCDIYGTTLIQYPSGRSGAYEVPQQIKVLTYASFKNNKGLTEVTFEEGSAVKTIGWETFSGCSNLTKITVPDTVVSFDFYAFENCTALTDVILGEDSQVTGVYKGAFYGCTALANISLPDAVVEIGEYAFYNCTSLTRFPLSESAQVKGIYDFAFHGCSGIAQIPAFTKLDEVGEYAFAYTSITEYTVPASVKEIAANAFTGCENFTTIYCDENNTEYIAIDGALYEKGADSTEDFDALVIWPENKAYVIGEGLSTLQRSDTNILMYRSAHNVEIADTVTEIASYAFMDLRELRKVIIPESVTSIGSGAFSGCVSLEEANLPNSVTQIPSYAFYNCRGLERITIPESVTSIGSGAFSGCVSLEEANLPNGVTQISDYAFNECRGLERITIPESVTAIGSYAFDDCINLKEVYYNAVNISDLASESNVFRNIAENTEQGAKVFVGANVTRIPAYLFYTEKAWVGYDIQRIYSVTFEETSACKEIGQYAFAYTNGLRYVDLPEGLLKISNNVFYACKDLVALMIPESVNSIGGEAFGSCDSLTVMYSQKDHPSEGSSAVGASECENVCSYDITENGQFYCITNDNTVTVSKYFGDESTLTIPDEIEGYPVTEIADTAYYRNDTLKMVIIPDGVTRIGAWAFASCGQLHGVLISETVTDLESYAFSGYSGMILLEGEAYPGADSLPPNAVANVAEWGIFEEAFFYCITMQDEVVVGSCLDNSASVSIPNQIKGKPVVATKGTFAGKSKLTFVQIPDSVTEIGMNSFLNCSSLSEVVIPDGVTHIGNSAFYACSSLVRVLIPDRVIEIGDSAFSNCKNLQELTIGKNVTTIGNAAFSECVRLQQINFNACEMTEVVGREAFLCAGEASDGIRVIFEKDVTRIPDGLFRSDNASKASRVTEVIFGEGSCCTYIGQRAFQNVTTLNTISIPDAVTHIGDYAFDGCDNLVIMVEGTELPAVLGTSWNGASPVCINAKTAGRTDYGQLYWVNQDDTVTLAQYTGSVTEIEIPSYVEGYPVTEIANSAFSGCTNLITVRIPDTVTKIGDSAFNGCNGLKSVNIPEGVTDIGAMAFNECTGLKELEIPESVTRVGQKAFYGCTSLNVIINAETLPENRGKDWDTGVCVCTDVSRIGYTDSDLTYYVTNSDSIVIGKYYGSAPKCDIPEQIEEMPVTKIASSAFYNRADLSDVNIPRQVVSIGNYAFYGCTMLTNIQIDAIALEDLAYTNYSFYNAGKNSGSLTVVFGNEVSRIPAYLFYADNYESNATRVHITDIVFSEGTVCQSIGAYAFRECYKLKNVQIPNTVTSIGVEAFSHCDGVNAFWIPSSTTNIEWRAFYLCRMLMFEADVLSDGIVLDPKEETTVILSATSYGVTEDGFFYCISKDGTAVVGSYSGSASNVIIPETVYDATVVGIAYKTFYLCKTISTVLIPDTVTFIGSEAFYSCKNLTSLDIPDSVRSIGQGAFSNCSNLTDITLPCGLEEIPEKMAYFCSKLTNVTIPEGVKSIGYIAFSYCNGINHIAIPDSVEYIESSAFNGCQCLETVTLPENDNLLIERYAFSKCYNLRSIIIPENAKIEDYAFQNCNQLSLVQIHSVGIAKSLTSGTSAGYLCNYAKTVILPAEFTELGSYITANYTTIEDIIADGIYYVAYSNHIHEWETQSVTEWVECEQDGVSAYTCSICTLQKVMVEPAHKLGEWTVISQNGCEDNGEERRNCLNCDYYETREIPASGHSYESVVTEPTCTEDGYTTHTCTRCDDTYTDSAVEALGHDMGDWYTAEEATCTEDGEQRRDCDRCDHYETQLLPELGHNYESVVTAPTCTEDGYTTHTCSRCDDSYTDTPVEALGHDMGAWETTKEATCTEDGEQRRDCSRCDHFETKVVTKLGHDYKAVVTAPTCTEDGHTTHTCTRCDDTYTDAIVKALGHDMGEWYITKEATCTEDGEQRRDCSRCDHYETQVVTKLGHDYKDVVTSPTCTEDGYTTHTCSRCDDTYTDAIVKALGHDMGEWETTKEATCTEDGEQRRDCDRCDHYETEALTELGHDYKAVVTDPTCTEDGYTTHTCIRCEDTYTDTPVEALGHDWDEGKVTVEPTEETTGEMLYTCERCGETKMEVIPELDHIHSYEAVATAPTCTEQGYTTYTCRCGDSYVQDYVEALGHDMGEWETTKEATCTEDGEQRRDCDRCDHFETNVVTKLGHDYKDVVTAPTCTEDGYTTHTCSRCDDTYTDTPVAALGHNFGNWGTTREATCTEDGEQRRDCDRCDHFETKVVDKLGHDYKAVVTAPTCTEAGYTTHTCTRCNDSYVDTPVDALGHDMGAWETTKEATCTEDGEHRRDCSRCEHFETKVVTKLGHDYQAVVTDPTCTEDGYTTHTCTRCDDSYTDTPVEALGHDWDEGKVTVEPTEETTGEMLYTCERCGETKTEVIPELDHEHSYEAVVTAPTCTEQGYTTYTCPCGESYVADYTDALGHTYRDGVCAVCGTEDPAWRLPLPGVIRIAGSDRIATSLMLADQLKDVLGVEKFDAVVVASALNFPDALTGSYLAAEKNAPILLTYPAAHAKIRAYIQENLKPGGMVYILGGEGAVSADFADGLNGFNVKRLAGSDRFGTNLAIMEEAGVSADQPVLIATAVNFADSLSASAAGLPMVLVYGSLREDQKEFLATTSRNFIIIGGEAAVSKSLENELAAIGSVTRVAGSSRYETSVLVAERFVQNPDAVILAYAKNFPDGLCGGPLAYALGAPLILTDSGAPGTADGYVRNITSGIVVGGSGLISDAATRDIFDMAANAEIQTK